MVEYKIEGGSLPIVTCYPKDGQTLVCERGSMSWMSNNMRMETKSGGFKKFFGRIFSGESGFLSEFTPEGGDGMITFSSSFPGSIIPIELRRNEEIVVQKGSFLAMEKGIDLSVYFQKKLGNVFFGGEGFIMQKLSGEGMVFLEIDGYCKELELGMYESVTVDTGYLAAMTAGCTMEIIPVKGVKNVLFGGEGLFHTKITGPGKVYLQSMPINKTAEALAPYLPTSFSGSSDGIKINLGND